MEPWQWAITVIGGLVVMYVPFFYWVGRSIMKDEEQRERALCLAESQLASRAKPTYTIEELTEAAGKIEDYMKRGTVKPEKCERCGK